MAALSGHIVYSLTFKCVNGASFNTCSLPRCSRFFNTSTQQLFKEIRDSLRLNSNSLIDFLWKLQNFQKKFRKCNSGTP